MLREKIGENEFDELEKYDGFYYRDQRGNLQPDVYEWANYMIERYHFVHGAGGNYIYDKNFYRKISDSEIEFLLSYTTLERAKPTHRSGFIKTLLSKAFKPPEYFKLPDGKINLNNGIFDLKENKLIPHSSEYFFTYCLPIDYDPKAGCDGWLNFLANIFPDNLEYVIIIAQIFGYVLIGGDQWLHKAFVLYGEGRNGKSTLLHILQKLIGKNNFSSVSLSNINKPFSAVNLDGKLANIVGESPTDKINAEIFKEATSGGYITAAKKYQDEYEFECQARFIFACNELPRFGENTVGMQERLYFIPFKKYFNKNERDRNIKSRLETELPGILNWALMGLRMLLDNGYLPETSATVELMDEYNSEIDSVYSWAKEYITYDPTLSVPYSAKELYNMYKISMQNTGRHIVSDATFSKRLRKYLKSQGWFKESDMFDKMNKKYRYIVVGGVKKCDNLSQQSSFNH